MKINGRNNTSILLVSYYFYVDERRWTDRYVVPAHVALFLGVRVLDLLLLRGMPLVARLNYENASVRAHLCRAT